MDNTSNKQAFDLVNVQSCGNYGNSKCHSPSLSPLMGPFTNIPIQNVILKFLNLIREILFINSRNFENSPKFSSKQRNLHKEFWLS